MIPTAEIQIAAARSEGVYNFMLRKEKSVQVDSLKKKLEASNSIFLADFTGVNVQDVDRLRRSFDKISAQYIVAKNTLIKRAIADTPLDRLNPYLTGPTAIVIAQDEGVEAARIIDKFAKGNQSFKVKVGIMNSKLVDPEQVKNIAGLPPREVLLARLLGVINAPIANLVFLLSQTSGRLVRVLDQIRQAKEAHKDN